MKCGPMTITDSNGTVLLDLSSSIESQLCKFVNETQPAFEKINNSDAIYAMIKLGTVTDSFGVGDGNFDITLVFYLDLCLSPTGMGLYFKVSFTIGGSIKSFQYTGLNKFVADINDIIEEYDSDVSDCIVCPDSWEIDTLPTDDTITVPGIGPVTASGGISQLLSFTPI